MTPLAVFVRTFLKTSAIFIGVTAVMLHPSLQWSEATGSSRVIAGQGQTEMAVDALVGALKDTDAGVRRQAAAALGEFGDASAVDPLIAVIRDANADVRRHVIGALGELGDSRALEPLTAAL